MNTFFQRLGLGLLLVSAGARGAAAPTQIPADRCNDLVVVGRIHNIDYTHIDMDGDILGHGWIRAQVDVRKVLKGSVVRAVLPVRYFEHAYLREDRDFLLVLRPADAGGYTIVTARLLHSSWRARLGPRCDR